MILIYLSYISEDHSKFYLDPFTLFCFHLLFLMLIWSFAHSSISEPGVVPPYWGFYMGDSEHKRKRYCLLCHVFKPDRCHHCSICNRCVLNMDHHCRNSYLAWINNCIGFYNRKLFMLMLFYSLATGYFVLSYFASKTYNTLQVVLETHNFTYSQMNSTILTLVLFIFCVILTKFSLFHVQLIKKNSTTIESLENNYNQSYSISIYRNFTQVFGRNPWIWLLPYYGNSGKPSGDGIIWPMIESQYSDSDVNVESEANRENSVKPMNAFAGPDGWPPERKSESPYIGKSPSDTDTDISFIRLNKRTPSKP